MNEHTPGPWVIGKRKDGSRWLSIGDPKTGPHYQADIHCGDADALLITAAPDLLEAAKAVLAGLNARIDAADKRAVPVFDGIADLHSAIFKAGAQP